MTFSSSMNLLKLRLHHQLHPKLFHYHPTNPKPLTLFPFKSLSFPILQKVKPSLYSSPIHPSFTEFKLPKARFTLNGNHQEAKEEENIEDFEYLAKDSEVYQKTLRLVECAMFAAVSGLVYILSNSLSIENYFGCFFALPIVLFSVRSGIAAGRKTMVATSMLLLVLIGPVKALTYMLSYGLLGFSMGSMWRLRASWGVSIFLCSTVRAMGALGSVSVSSLLIGEDILSLIIVNVHAAVVYLFTNCGITAVPSVAGVYGLFGFLLLLNSTFFVFLLHFLYAVFFTKFGMKPILRLPRWVDSAI